MNAALEIQDSVVNISIIGINKHKVELNNNSSANKLISFKVLEEKNCKEYDPNLFIQKRLFEESRYWDFRDGFSEIDKPKYGKMSTL